MQQPNQRLFVQKSSSLNLISTLRPVALLCCLALSSAIAVRPIPKIFTINSTADDPDLALNGICATAKGDCTLRAAIMEANNTSNSIINFDIPTTQPNCDPNTGACTVNLNTVLPNITAGVTINGSGAAKTTVRRGNNAPPFAIFTVTSSASVGFASLTITNGHASGSSGRGGGINNISCPSVDILNCVLTGNTADAEGGNLSNGFSGGITFENSTAANGISSTQGGDLYNDGTMTISTSVISGGKAPLGGNISNNNHLTLNSSTVSGGTSSGDGGGIYTTFDCTLNSSSVTACSATGNGAGIANDGSSSSASVTLANCTVSHCIAGQDGGGIYNIGSGDFLNPSSGTVTLTNSTIADNSAFDQNNPNSGGGIYTTYQLFVTNSTIANNGGGGIVQFLALDVGGMEIKSSILAGNHFSGSNQPPDVIGFAKSDGYNLIGQINYGTGFSAPTDLNGVDPGFVLDGNNQPLLQNNGGPTETIALKCGSIAIDQGTSASLQGSLTTDQRGTGFKRTFDDPAPSNADDGTDIGAFETQQGCGGHTCSQVVFSENFDAVTPPALPAGWTGTDPGDSAANWASSSVAPDSGKSDVTAVLPSQPSDQRLDSPVINLPGPARLRFRNMFTLTNASAVLEISINGGAFTDILAAGGSFVAGGYNATGPVDGTNQPVWMSGTDSAYITTIVNFPAAAAGNEIQLRWRLAHADAQASSNESWTIDTIEVSGCTGFVTPTPTPTPTATPTATPGSLANVSTRLQIGTGNNVLFAGFIIQGSGSKTLLIRSIGPSLTGFGVPGAMSNPKLELHDANNIIGTNDNWQTTQLGGVITSDQVAAIQNSGAAPSDPAEPAIIATLPAGQYSAIVQGVGGTQGVATVEVYDLSLNNGAVLANISTRGFVQTGDDVMIGGFIIVGQATKVLILAIGPSLTQFGIDNALANPRLDLHDANGTLAGNDDWQTTELGGIITSDQSAAIQNSGLAPNNSAESAIIATLPPGNYTAIEQGVNDGTGVGLVEVYTVP